MRGLYSLWLYAPAAIEMRPEASVLWFPGRNGVMRSDLDTPAAVVSRAKRSPVPYEVRLARDEGDVVSAQSLRYRVFVTELGGDGPMVDHAAGLERDERRVKSIAVALGRKINPRKLQVVDATRRERCALDRSATRGSHCVP